MMRTVLLFLSVLLFSCDSKRIIEEYKDIPNHLWISSDTIRFPLSLPKADTVSFYCRVRNDLDYSFSRIFIQYSFCDSLGHELWKGMKGQYLFDSKTGEPLGQSGIGDVFDHPLLLKKMSVAKGRYHLKISHKMRKDSLPGILAIGVRVEK